MNERKYRLLSAFCGAGGGALGFLQAEARLLGVAARFESIGGIDFDPDACLDFEYLTESPALCADIAQLTPAELRAFAGPRAPDCVFLSPPCKGASGLLSKKLAASPKYRAMNTLALTWIELMLAAWQEPPRLVLIENVPRLKNRAASMLRKLRAALRAAGYVVHDGFHDCGELGGLAQHRRRYLLVARHARRVPPLLYQPPKKRVRACGEVLGELPLPGDPSAGPLHRLPRLSWLNWVRLSLIPAGGDWRDLDGVLRDGQPRREVFRRHQVQCWDAPAGTIAGSGSNGPSAVADPRFSLSAEPGQGGRGQSAPPRHRAPQQGVATPDKPQGWPSATLQSHTVTREGHRVTDPGSALRFAFDACKPGSHHNKFRVEDWNEPAHTVIGATRIGSGAASVADPRISVARAFDHGYGVLKWVEPSPTVASGSNVGQGAYSVADVRFGGEYYPGAYGILDWREAAGTITANGAVSAGRFAVADPRRPPPDDRIIIAADGTWHRPLTTLELAALQGLPTIVRGKPLELSGKSTTGWRERIGNLVPPPAAREIATRMLVALVSADANAFALDGGLDVWVEREALNA